jgi:hypothetical protein
MVASGGSDGAVRLWETATGKKAFKLEGHAQEVHSVAFSHDGATLASGMSDTTVLIWSLASHGGVGPATAELWKDLEGEDDSKAWRAIWSLAERPEEVIDFVRGKLVPMPEERFKRLLADLDEDEVEIRERAEREFGEFPPWAIKRALKGDLSAEARNRIERAMRRWESSKSGDQLRWGRVVQALERIGSEEACKLLE